MAELEKVIKIKGKEQTNVGELRTSIAAKERKISGMKERLKRDAQEKRVSELRRERAQVQDILESEPSPSDEEGAKARLAEIDEELARLETQIEESEAAMLLRERTKEIFKENGVTLTAILLAAGVTIGVVVGALTNALKATSKALGNGLKNECWFYSVRADRLDCEVPLQNRWAGHRLSRRAHLAPDFGGGCLCSRKVPQKAALKAIYAKAPTTTAPTMVAVLLASCCEKFFTLLQKLGGRPFAV